MGHLGEHLTHWNVCKTSIKPVFCTRHFIFNSRSAFDGVLMVHIRDANSVQNSGPGINMLACTSNWLAITLEHVSLSSFLLFLTWQINPFPLLVMELLLLLVCFDFFNFWWLCLKAWKLETRAVPKEGRVSRLSTLHSPQEKGVLELIRNARIWFFKVRMQEGVSKKIILFVLWADF